MSLLRRRVGYEQTSRNEPGNPQATRDNWKTSKSAWEYYNEVSGVIDRERERDWLEQMDTVLIFAGLFAAFLSAFLIELLDRLEQNPMDVIRDILIYQTQMMRNLTLEPYSPPEFTPSPHIIAVNALFYASLGIMLLAAFIAMLIKSWVREFDRGLSRMSIPEQSQDA